MGPSAFPNALKDVEAWRYFASKGLIARNIFSQMTMNSPDNRKQFSVAPNNTELYIRPTIPELIPYNIKKEDCFESQLSAPSDYSKFRLDQRPSVITSSNINQSRVGDQVERPKMIQIKEEKPDEYTEENNTPSDHLESTPTSSSKVYLPESYSFTRSLELIQTIPQRTTTHLRMLFLRSGKVLYFMHPPVKRSVLSNLIVLEFCSYSMVNLR